MIMQEHWALILAAGSSSRMGRQKLLLPYNGCTMIEKVLHNVLGSRVEKVVVVLGNDHDEIAPIIRDHPVKICRNPDPRRGMLSTVRCGIREIPEGAGTALIYLGDQPGIPPAITNRILDAYNGALKGIVLPVFNHRRGHPLLVDMKYRKEIDKLDPETGLRSLMHHFPGDVLEVEVDEPGILVDIDTREDYSKATHK